MKILSPIRVVTLFCAILIFGVLLVPGLQVQLLPDESVSPELQVVFSLPESSPEVLEQQVTAQLENGLSRLSGLKQIQSRSAYNNGNIHLRFDEKADMQVKQFEVVALIRLLYPQLPAQVSYPVVNIGDNTHQRGPALIYTINAPLQPFQLKTEMNRLMSRTIADIDGINNVMLSGVTPMQMAIQFDGEKCHAWHISPVNIATAVRARFKDTYPGMMKTVAGEELVMHINPGKATINDVENLCIATINKLPVTIKQVATVSLQEAPPQRYFRINGKNSITLSVYTRKDVNQLSFVDRARKRLETAFRQLPAGYEYHLDYDDTSYLKKEIGKNLVRMGLSLLLLLLFILIAYNSWRHAVLLLSALLANTALVLIIASAIHIPLHLYSMAGLTISLGLMTDNAILMMDHYHRYKNRKVLRVMMGANLIIIVALSLIFHLPREDQKNLHDLALMLVCSLACSLITSVWFIPGTYHLLNKDGAKERRFFIMPSLLKRRIRIYYADVIFFILRYRKLFSFGLVLLFGLPVFLMPRHWDGDSLFHKAYNETFGSDWYDAHVKPYANKYLGGTLRLFVNNMRLRSGYRTPEKTVLHIQARLPHGATIQQMDQLMQGYEKILSSVRGIHQFITDIHSGQDGDIKVIFKEDYENSNLPYLLRNWAISRSQNKDGVEWNIYGVGRGFSTSNEYDNPHYLVTLKGYNYDQLEAYAKQLAKQLEQHPRVQRVNADERANYEDRMGSEWVLHLDNMQMALHHTDKTAILSALSENSAAADIGTIAVNNIYYPLVVQEQDAAGFSDFDLLNGYLHTNTAQIVRIGTTGTLSLQSTTDSIYKEDRSYVRLLSFDYAGDDFFGARYLDDVLKKFRTTLTPGYTAESSYWSWNWLKEQRQYGLLLLLIIASFGICCIMFESMRQPFYIIFMAPLAFIGLFLSFSIGNYYFDQGGYTAFIISGALVINAAIFIVNDLNVLRRKHPHRSYNQLVLFASVNRSRTIILTFISTCCGLIPFLYDGEETIFWFSLAVGTIGAIIASIFVVLVMLPVFLMRKKNRNR